MAKVLLSILLFLSSHVFAYELTIVQGLSKENHTFVTRNTSGKDHKLFEGKRVTFTSNNVSVIAKALTVTKEFVQWELLNDYTDVPFKRGEILTMYDSRPFLWALNPEKVKRRLLRHAYLDIRRSLEAQFAFSRGLSESTSLASTVNTQRGGFMFEGSFRHELNATWSMAYGIRYDRDVLNLPQASYINQRFMGTIELRYYFDPMDDFYNGQVGLGLGMGFGQSRSETAGQATFGTAMLMPSTKLSISFPIDRFYELEFVSAFDSIRLEEQNANQVDQTTNMVTGRAGVIIRKHFK